MNTDRLGTALQDLVNEVEEGGAPPVAGELWAGGRARRHTSVLVSALAAACVAALAALLVWPMGAPRASVPAVRVDSDGTVRLTAHPSAIPKPPFIGHSGRPGVTAAVVAEYADAVHLYAVSPAGGVTRLVLPDAPLGTSDSPALSPDGHWLARGFLLTDLVRGVTMPDVPVRNDLQTRRLPVEDPPWWSPDSRRVYVSAFNQGKPTSTGFVMATDGSVTEAPLLAGGQVPVVAGWLDDDTVLAFVDVGGGTPRLEGRTWRVGAPVWEVSGAEVEWPSAGTADGSQGSAVRASLSPDGSRLLLTRPVTDADTGVFRFTEAMLFDARTGAALGMPGADGTLTSAGDGPASLSWAGWGCRPAWRAALPVITDDRIRRAVVVLGDDLVTVSSRYDSPCVAFAGNELRGRGTVDTVAVWQERLWVWGGRLLALAGLVFVVRWFTRRRSWNAGADTRRPVLPFLPSRG